MRHFLRFLKEASRHHGTMTIKHWPISERPRERLLHQGVDALSDAELLAILLGSGIQGLGAVDLARQMLSEHQGLHGIASQSAQELQRINGLGPARVTRILAATEMAKRMMRESLTQRDAVTDPHSAAAFCQARLGTKKHEVFAAFFLDSKHRTIAFEELFEGTINGAHVYLRTLIKRCLAHNAAALIVTHNHPSGDPTPSQTDVDLTQRIHEALVVMDVRLLDHIVVGRGSTVSIKQVHGVPA